MSINKLGPKEIYSYGQPLHNICKEDSQSAVEKYKKFYQAGGEGEFKNGDGLFSNVLMLASALANVSLVKYILENSDPKILNMRDYKGFSALHYAVMSQASKEKVFACTQMLLQAGADPDARWTYKEYDQSNPPPPETTLDDDNFKGPNALGWLVHKQTSSYLTTDNKEKYEELTQLFLANGATHGYWVAEKPTEHNGYFIAEDGANDNDARPRAHYGRILKQMTEKVLKWPKTRILALAKKDATSPLSALPEELLNIIHNKITQPSN